jgi:hypothetical protein
MIWSLSLEDHQRTNQTIRNKAGEERCEREQAKERRKKALAVKKGSGTSEQREQEGKGADKHLYKDRSASRRWTQTPQPDTRRKG